MTLSGYPKKEKNPINLYGHIELQNGSAQDLQKKKKECTHFLNALNKKTHYQHSLSEKM